MADRQRVRGADGGAVATDVRLERVDEGLAVRETRTWGSLLVPIHLQLLEALRSVSEGRPGATWCRECGEVFLTLDARRSTFCTDRERMRRSRRLVILPEAVRVELRAHRTRQKMDRLAAGSRWVDSSHVFATMLSRPHHAATISRAFQDALDRAELSHIRFHDLRHSAATFLLSQGFGLEDVKNLLGHSTIVLTSNTYGHVLEQRQPEMARGMDAVLGG